MRFASAGNASGEQGDQVEASVPKNYAARLATLGKYTAEQDEDSDIFDTRRTGRGSGTRRTRSSGSSGGWLRRLTGSTSALNEDFVREMRHLSKLRHPCITTVMGYVALMADKNEWVKHLC